jgi:hypothetical protein
VPVVAADAETDKPESMLGKITNELNDRIIAVRTANNLVDNRLVFIIVTSSLNFCRKTDNLFLPQGVPGRLSSFPAIFTDIQLSFFGVILEYHISFKVSMTIFICFHPTKVCFTPTVN